MLQILYNRQPEACKIKHLTQEMGFDLCGVARAEPLIKDSACLQTWLKNDYNAEMEWLGHSWENRVDPGLVLPNCRSVIVLGANYYNEDRTTTGYNEPFGKIARFAVLPDYHKTLGRSVKQLAGHIQQSVNPSAKTKWFVDTGPVMEKVWARRAGLGFRGKNTLLINPRRGSWFLLGVILTTLELEPDEMTGINCGTCRRCIDACPTGALREPGILDARRCLSYWTIERRAVTMDTVKFPLNGWLFGCDLCQEVCPFNLKFQRREPLNPMLGQPILPARLNLNELLEAMENEEFHRRFIKNTPLRRVGRERLRLNAAALKNS